MTITTAVERMANADIIPDDVVPEILVRLPVKSLLRFRCVCKVWDRIIADSCFIESHRIRSATRSDGNLLLVCYHLSPSMNQMKTIFSMYNWEEGEKGKDCNSSTQEYLRSHDISESINGLICLNNNGQQPQVCNLSTRESVMLPPPPPPSSRSDFSRSSYYSLGFDPCSNTYKILRMLKPKYPIFQVLTLGSDTWKEVVFDSFNFSIDGNLRGLCVGGSLYWNTGTNRTLLAFGVAEERFRLIPQPPSRTGVSFLGRLDGQLAAVDNSWLMKDQTMDLWILLNDEDEDDDDKNGVWSIIQKIVFSRVQNLVGFGGRSTTGMAYPKRLFGFMETIHGGQLVIVWHTDLGAEAYIYASCCDDLESCRRVKSLRKPWEVPGFTCCTAACHYVESMISLRQIINSYKP